MNPLNKVQQLKSLLSDAHHYSMDDWRMVGENISSPIALRVWQGVWVVVFQHNPALRNLKVNTSTGLFDGVIASKLLI